MDDAGVNGTGMNDVSTNGEATDGVGPDGLIGRLLSLLNSDLDVYRDLLELARKKREILVTGDLRALEALLEVEQALVQRAGRLEDERAQVMGSLARVWGVPGDSLTLRDVENRCRGHAAQQGSAGTDEGSARARVGSGTEQEVATVLVSVGETLNSLLGELQTVNRENAHLIRRSLSLISHSLDAILPDQDGAAYGSHGRRETILRGPRAVDHQV
ncbi:MAG TPA: flagellar protein FlgN [Firmicutes bacterium]|nr:flagellar protein FlgN [Bacillota bacterium]